MLNVAVLATQWGQFELHRIGFLLHGLGLASGFSFFSNGVKKMLAYMHVSQHLLP